MPGTLTLPIEWSGPCTPQKVIASLNDAGEPPGYDGDDYGLYQIYGRHILGDRNALLYIGEATDQTFAQRFRQHRVWLEHEYRGIQVVVGRLYISRRHTPVGDWMRWRTDVLLAERALIYTYSPHYNSSSITDRPNLDGLNKLVLVHRGARRRLRRNDVLPRDWD